MDTATAAAMSDPERNPLFRRRWEESDQGELEARYPGGDEADLLHLTGLELLEQWRRERAAVQAERSEVQIAAVKLARNLDLACPESGP